MVKIGRGDFTVPRAFLRRLTNQSPVGQEPERGPGTSVALRGRGGNERPIGDIPTDTDHIRRKPVFLQLVAIRRSRREIGLF
jgi:hypothetical protein